MAIQQPSQYDIDNMKEGDTVYVIPRNFLYKWYRQKFTDKIKLNIPYIDKSNNKVFKKEYQEDCTLIHNYELVAQQILKDDLYYKICIGNNNGMVYKLNSIEVGLNNIRIRFFKNLSILIPTSYIENAIRKNNYIVDSTYTQQRCEDILNQSGVSPQYIKKVIKLKNLKNWIPMYCNICGKPIIFNFKKDSIDVINKCKCGNIKLNYNHISYEQFYLWLMNQNNPSIINKINKDWFGVDK